MQAGGPAAAGRRRAPGAPAARAPAERPRQQAAAGARRGPLPAADGDRRPARRSASSFNVAEAAGGAVDDAQERWLIQKDKLDFGPFSLAQIRAQIERGEILGEHMIVDSDTGARKKVKDFPPLREFTKTSERRLEQQRRANAEHPPRDHREEEVDGDASLVGASSLVVVGGGVGVLRLTRKAADGTKLASREEEADIDAFLKDVKLNFADRARRQARQRRRTTQRGGARATTPSSATTSNFGDVSKYASGGDETLDDGVDRGDDVGPLPRPRPLPDGGAAQEPRPSRR